MVVLIAALIARHLVAGNASAASTEAPCGAIPADVAVRSDGS
jgi:hypothetical protein